MAQHHTVTRFHLARWARNDGYVEVLDRRGLEVRHDDPRRVGALRNFNEMKTPDGRFDLWLEHEFLAGLDSSAAGLMRQLENVPRPRSQLKMTRSRGWHPGHVLAPKWSTRIAMYLGTQAVRTPAWRSLVSSDTSAAIKERLESTVRSQLDAEQRPDERARLVKMLGLRYYAQVTADNVG